MKITDDSHLDHGLTEAHEVFLLEKFEHRDDFFIETVELPEHLSDLECRLHGPAMGDPSVPESEVGYVKRGERAYPSRVINRPTRKTRKLTVIAGPHDGEPCVLYTAFGGPLTPREPDDPTLPGNRLAESVEFWRQHALTTDEVLTPNPGYCKVGPDWAQDR